MVFGVFWVFQVFWDYIFKSVWAQNPQAFKYSDQCSQGLQGLLGLLGLLSIGQYLDQLGLLIHKSLLFRIFRYFWVFEVNQVYSSFWNFLRSVKSWNPQSSQYLRHLTLFCVLGLFHTKESTDSNTEENLSSENSRNFRENEKK